MSLFIKKQHVIMFAFFCIVMNCVGIGAVCGGQDPPQLNAITELTEELISEKERTVQEKSQTKEVTTQQSQAATELTAETISGKEGIVQEKPQTIKKEVAQEKPQAIEVTTRLFEVKNVNVNEAKEKLQALLTTEKNKTSSIETITIQKSGQSRDFLVVTSTPQNIEKMSLMIEQLEKEFAPSLINVDFNDVELSKVLTTIARMTGLNIIGGDELSQKVSLHLKDVPLDTVFDTLLMSTGYTYVRKGRVLHIVSQKEAPSAPLMTEIFKLQYASANKVKQVAENLISKEGKLTEFSKYSDKDYSNYLIVTDTAEVIEGVRQLVQKLDEKIQQVMIEAKFVEVSLDKADALGLDWVLQGSITGASGPTAFPITKRGGNLLQPPFLTTDSSSKITLGTMSFSDFSVKIRALDTKAEVNLIANPSVSTREGEEAKIVIGEKVPIPLYQHNEHTGALEVTGYETQDVGVLLRVTPIINKDNTVSLNIHPEVSEITGFVGPNNERPIISTREVTTSFTVENGKTIVIGGLTKETISNNVNKVPFIGHIPILGEVFTYHNKSNARKEVLIFITPHILGEY